MGLSISLLPETGDAVRVGTGESERGSYMYVGRSNRYPAILQRSIAKPAAVVPQVDDESVGIVQRCHNPASRLLTGGRIRKPIQFHVTDVVRQGLDRLEQTVLLKQRCAIALAHFRRHRWWRARRQPSRAVDHVSNEYAARDSDSTTGSLNVLVYASREIRPHVERCVLAALI